MIMTNILIYYWLLEYLQVITGKSFYPNDLPGSFCNKCAILMGFFKKRGLLDSLSDQS